MKKSSNKIYQLKFIKFIQRLFHIKSPKNKSKTLLLRIVFLRNDYVKKYLTDKEYGYIDIYFSIFWGKEGFLLKETSKGKIYKIISLYSFDYISLNIHEILMIFH